MKAAIHDRYGPPRVARVGDHRSPGAGGIRCWSASGPRRSTGPTSTASSRGRASSGLFLGLRAPREPTDRDRRRRRRGGRRAGRDPVQAGRPRLRRPVRVRRRAPSPSTSARRSGRSSRSRTGCRSRTPPRCRTRRSSRSRGCAPATAGPSGRATRSSIDRRVGQRRPVRGPDREVAWRGGHRRLQHRQGRLRPVARRRPRHRLQEGRLHDDRRALRLDPRHRLAPLDPSGPARSPPNGVYVTLGGTACRSSQALVVGPLISLFSDRGWA